MPGMPLGLGVLSQRPWCSQRRLLMHASRQSPAPAHCQVCAACTGPDATRIQADISTSDGYHVTSSSGALAEDLATQDHTHHLI